MIHRKHLTLPNSSFFLFGPRGTGKTTWLSATLTKGSIIIDLLNPEIEDRYRQDPSLLKREIESKLPLKKEYIAIDEIQKVPRLLDVVHQLIEKHNIKFAMTGSSARKLKRGSANLLAGRAIILYLFPFTHIELKENFDLIEVLTWGSLPKIYNLKNNKEKEDFLRAYTLVYLNEEIKAEQIVRKIEPFRDFLEISAIMSGKIINYSKIASEAGCDIKTVQNYFQILEDTMIGFFLPHYHRSIRKAQRKHPKFYYFDTGVRRSLERALDIKIKPKTAYFGELFEQFIITEINCLQKYLKKDWRLSYFQTQNSAAEIDLIIDRGKRTPYVIEIKSTNRVDIKEIKSLQKISKDLKPSKIFYLSRDPIEQKLGKVHCLFWQEGIKKIFNIK